MQSDGEAGASPRLRPSIGSLVSKNGGEAGAMVHPLALEPTAMETIEVLA